LRTTVSARGRKAIAAAILIAALCLGVSACGSSAPSGTEADPASLAPSSSVLYVSAALHPEGTLRQSALTDMRTLSHEREPLAKLLQAIAGSGALESVDFKREIEPWVGTDAGLFTTSPAALSGAAESIGGALGGGISPAALLHAASAGLLAQKSVPAALVLDTRNLEGARAFVGKIAGRQGARHDSDRGVAYEASAQGTAEAIVGKFVVIGDEAGVKAAIETHLGGPSLTSSGSPYARLAANGPAGSLAGIYLSPQTGQAASLLQALPGTPKQARISIVPEHSSLQIDVDLLAASEQAQAQAASAATQAAGLLAGLPEDSWLAAGFGESGARAAGYLKLLGTVVGLAGKSVLANFGGPALQSLLQRLGEHPTAVQQIFSGWAGPAAAFAAGSGLLSIQAGLVIQSRSTPAGPAAALVKLGALLSAAGAQVSPTSVPGAQSALSVRVQGLPITLDMGAGAGKLVIGLGPESVQGALSPTGALSSSSLYGSASSSLGGKPSVILDFPMALSLLEGLGIEENPSLAPTLGYLRSLGTLSGSVQGLGGAVLRLHLLAALQE
jgi:hypothetical protein